MFEKLESIEKRYQEIEELLGKPEIISDQINYQKYAKEFSDLKEIVGKYRSYKEILKNETEILALFDSSSEEEFKELAKTELEKIKKQKENKENELLALLLPKDPWDEKDVFLEIRQGTGGEEAALFAADLLRMYLRYAEDHGWKSRIVDENPTGLGGYKEVIVEISGKGAYSKLKYESGIHRVQRVPRTEASGRIHTSASSVAILPEADDFEIKIDQKDLRVDTFRASGAGGQHVNKTSSAVRITHLPTGIVVQCQDERSQHQNRAKAMRLLTAKLWQSEEEKKQSQIRESRRIQVGSGDRSEKIRTYNFPQNRVTDHRINLTLYNLTEILDGHINTLIDSLASADQTAKLAVIGKEG